uniref:Pco140702 n=1 Tax=Arundo donax TaxID=35708 RepID=A0A0A9H4A7_ARUDO
MMIIGVYPLRTKSSALVTPKKQSAFCTVPFFKECKVSSITTISAIQVSIHCLEYGTMKTVALYRNNQDYRNEQEAPAESLNTSLTW